MLRKDPNLTGIDPETGEVVRLFHPRRDIWSDHLGYEGPAVVGVTAIGRTTVTDTGCISLRRCWRRDRWQHTSLQPIRVARELRASDNNCVDRLENGAIDAVLR